jgi:hypothetical protein
LGNLIFCSTILKGVTKKTAYHADFSGFCRMLASALLGYLVGVVVFLPIQGWLGVISVAIMACSAFLLVATIIKPFSDAERLRINHLIKRNLFVW